MYDYIEYMQVGIYLMRMGVSGLCLTHARWVLIYEGKGVGGDWKPVFNREQYYINHKVKC